MQVHSLPTSNPHFSLQPQSYRIRRARGAELERVSDAVFDAYYARFSAMHGWAGDERDKMRRDDARYALDASVFVAYTEDGQILATVRAIERREHPLPIEQDFGVDPLVVCQGFGWVPHRIFEIGRFARCAIPGVTEAVAHRAVDEVLASLVAHCGRHLDNVAFASIDVAVLELLRRKGFPFLALGEPVPYLGSPTVPVVIQLGVCAQQMAARNRVAYAQYFGTLDQAA